MNDFQGEVVAAVFTLVSFVYIFWPENMFSSKSEKTRLDYLMERKDQLFENLRNLNYAYHAGKCADDDFLMQQVRLEIEVSRLMTEIIDLHRD